MSYTVTRVWTLIYKNKNNQKTNISYCQVGDLE